MMQIALIVVFYNPTENQFFSFVELSKHIMVYAIDNSKAPIGWPFNSPNFHYEPLHGNKGIAYAQNIGISLAKSDGIEYVIFSDQDSVFTNIDIFKLVVQFNIIRSKDQHAGALGPIIINSSTKKNYKTKAIFDKEGFCKRGALISSGMLVPLEVLNDVGGLDEKLFIDLVDFDWCWRAIKKGYNLYMTNNVPLIHSVGKETVSFLGFPFIIASPIRYYYKYRNTIILVKKDYVPNTWKRKSLIKLFFNFIHVLFSKHYSGNRIIVLKHLLHGLKDGINN